MIVRSETAELDEGTEHKMELTITEVTTHERRRPTTQYVNGRAYHPTAADRREYSHKTIVYFSVADATSPTAVAAPTWSTAS